MWTEPQYRHLRGRLEKAKPILMVEQWMKTLPLGHAVLLSGSLELTWVSTKWLQICHIFLTAIGFSNLCCCCPPILFSFVTLITKAQLKTHCTVPLSLLMRRWCLGGGDFLCRRLWLTDKASVYWLGLSWCAWRGFLDLLPSSFLMQPGAKRGPALSPEGPFLLLFKQVPLCGTA